MNNEVVLGKLRGGLVVSCQALEDEPLHGSETMAKMAKAAKMGGAVGIRANTVTDITAIKKAVDLPVIGIIKKQYEGYDTYITPTMAEVEVLVAAGAEIIAIDATHRLHPGDVSAEDLIQQIKSRFSVLVMADISTAEEGIAAQKAGADILSTTLSGYTPYSPKITGPDFKLIKELADAVEIPVIAEGRIETPEQAKKCLEEGAFAVVVGGAITRPQLITKRFVNLIG